MKTITTNNRTLLFVEVPEDADNFTIEDDKLYYSDKIFKDAGGGWEILPEGNYRLIATTDTITEEQAANIVKRKDNGMYIDYLHYGEPYHNATISFKSLLQHHSITGRHAIIEQL